MEIVDKLLNHSRLALSKAITAVENEYDDAVKIMTEIYPHTGNAYVIGITGPRRGRSFRSCVPDTTPGTPPAAP